MYLQKAIFKNVSPFGDLKITFDHNQLIVFSGINGRGKTTILSYIADAFFEIAKTAKFDDVFEDATKYYRVTSPSNILDNAEYSFVYLRFVSKTRNIDYVEVVGQINSEEYEKICTFDNKISFSEFEHNLKLMGACKFVKTEMKAAREIFYENILTYFPFDRSEVPVWLNEIEYKKYRFNAKTRFSNNLNKNIEARIISDQVANWVLDVILDFTRSVTSANGHVIYSDIYSKMIYDSLNLIIQKTLSGKTATCRLGISQRKSGQSRISVVKDDDGQIKNISPSIFHLSSGEISLFILFAEIIKQYDTYCSKTSLNLSDITGIVVIDEIDKHLHIRLQKEILPALIALFPNLQFIVSGHSPFFSLGASELLKNRVRFLDLTIGGKEIAVSKIDELEELYNQILSGNENYKKLYEQLESDGVKSKQLRILTEGYNTKYIQKAIRLLAPELEEKVYICMGVEAKSGNKQLIQVYEVFSKANGYEKTLFVWDCDVEKETKDLIETDRVFKFTFDKNEDNKKVKKGIENLFNESFVEEKFYLTKKMITDVGEERSIQTFDKNTFCESMIALNSKDTFALFQPMINKIKSIITSLSSE